MDTSVLKKFAQSARRTLQEQVSAKLKVVLAPDSLARRENPYTVTSLEQAIKEHSQEYVIDKIAYIWFNRFSALRFMDANHYTSIGIVSPVEGQSQPEILAEAKMGHIDSEIVPTAVRQKVNDLINGQIPSKNPQLEAYRLLIVAACNYWNQAMPFLFEKINDYTELLMPDDLLSEQSTLTQMQTVMTPESCADVEIIGWLYQFYISEKKDEVFEGLKKNKKITPENIPAATQLFTPHWIVRYLVENSLGRLWMLNHPDSNLIKQMDYYIKPEQPETDFLKIKNPEEIKICDPACGSGHMLVYAFDLLYSIYEEEGYDASEIPTKILKNNLYGIEIDERAGELAAFALTMKARSRQRGFFRLKVQPNICMLENVKFDTHELKEYMAFIGHDLFTMQLQNTLHQFEEADNFGSLIRPELTDVETMLNYLNTKNASGNLFVYQAHKKVLRALEQADYLSSKYHVVIANPPYMGGSGMNGRLASWLKENYPEVKSDLFSAFIVRNTELALHKGQLGFMSPFVWMFIATYEKLRNIIIEQKTITSLIQLEYSGFDGATVPICTFTLENNQRPKYEGGYIRLSDFKGSENQSPKTLEAIKNHNCGWFYRASAVDFKKIPGSPIAFWISNALRETFTIFPPITNFASPKKGMMTGDNAKYLRLFWEVSSSDIFFGCRSHQESSVSNLKWYPHNKGGEFRKWYGNEEFLINFGRDGAELREFEKYGERNPDLYFKEGLSWTKITSSYFSARYSSEGHLYDDASCICFVYDSNNLPNVLGVLNSIVGSHIIKSISQTLNFSPGEIAKVPFAKISEDLTYIQQLIQKSKIDWNSYETSWGFLNLSLLKHEYRQSTLKTSYNKLRLNWQEMTTEMKSLEEQNNRTFIEAYGLNKELTPEVSLPEVTLICNPSYRYGSNKTKEELEVLLLADTMREFISYAVGCMLGRYSIDKPGLILASQGETIADYQKQVPSPTFMADEDNVIPILDGDWFADDIVERFRKFLQTTFGMDHFQENLHFIEDAIGKDIRSFFLKDFYNDHIKRYKKRPIYWLFSSPRATFNALIYMHRYRSDTVSIILNKYLREFKVKLSSRIEYLNRVEVSSNASKAEKSSALKEKESLKKNIDELDVWERDVIYPLALEQKEIDLDDGVKVNYPKFGAALKKISGLEVEED